MFSHYISMVIMLIEALKNINKKMSRWAKISLWFGKSDLVYIKAIGCNKVYARYRSYAGLGNILEDCNMNGYRKIFEMSEADCKFI